MTALALLVVFTVALSACRPFVFLGATTFGTEQPAGDESERAGRAEQGGDAAVSDADRASEVARASNADAADGDAGEHGTDGAAGAYGPGGAPGGEGEVRPPTEVHLVKMLSWADGAEGACTTDLEGTEPPAGFVLRYSEGKGPTVRIENDPNLLFGKGWSMVTRSERGYGFERAGRFSTIDFEVTEVLRCRCGPKQADHLAQVRVQWGAGGQPHVRGWLEPELEEAIPVEPVTISGRMVLYQFAFEGPAPKGIEGSCRSKFLVGLELDEPVTSP